MELDVSELSVKESIGDLSLSLFMCLSPKIV